jgi:hypothetical protein
MAKTRFQNGTIVEPAFLNLMYRTGGGHRHDGGNEDGSAEKVALGEHTDGTLPSLQQGLHKHDGDADTGNQEKINLTTEVRGKLPDYNIGAHTHDFADIQVTSYGMLETKIRDVYESDHELTAYFGYMAVPLSGFFKRKMVSFLTAYISGTLQGETVKPETYINIVFSEADFADIAPASEHKPHWGGFAYALQNGHTFDVPVRFSIVSSPATSIVCRADLSKVTAGVGLLISIYPTSTQWISNWQ